MLKVFCFIFLFALLATFHVGVSATSLLEYVRVGQHFISKSLPVIADTSTARHSVSVIGNTICLKLPTISINAVGKYDGVAILANPVHYANTETLPTPVALSAYNVRAFGTMPRNGLHFCVQSENISDTLAGEQYLSRIFINWLTLPIGDFDFWKVGLQNFEIGDSSVEAHSLCQTINFPSPFATVPIFLYSFSHEPFLYENEHKDFLWARNVDRYSAEVCFNSLDAGRMAQHLDAGVNWVAAESRSPIQDFYTNEKLNSEYIQSGSQSAEFLRSKTKGVQTSCTSIMFKQSFSFLPIVLANMNAKLWYQNSDTYRYDVKYYSPQFWVDNVSERGFIACIKEVGISQMPDENDGTFPYTIDWIAMNEAAFSANSHLKEILNQYFTLQLIAPKGSYKVVSNTDEVNLDIIRDSVIDVARNVNSDLDVEVQGIRMVQEQRTVSIMLKTFFVTLEPNQYSDIAKLFDLFKSSLIDHFSALRQNTTPTNQRIINLLKQLYPGYDPASGDRPPQIDIKYSRPIVNDNWRISSPCTERTCGTPGSIMLMRNSYLDAINNRDSITLPCNVLPCYPFPSKNQFLEHDSYVNLPSKPIYVYNYKDTIKTYWFLCVAGSFLVVIIATIIQCCACGHKVALHRRPVQGVYPRKIGGQRDSIKYSESDATGKKMDAADEETNIDSDDEDESYDGSSYTGSSYTGSSYTGSSYTGSSYTGSSYTGSNASSNVDSSVDSSVLSSNSGSSNQDSDASSSAYTGSSYSGTDSGYTDSSYVSSNSASSYTS